MAAEHMDLLEIFLEFKQSMVRGEYKTAVLTLMDHAPPTLEYFLLFAGCFVALSLYLRFHSSKGDTARREKRGKTP